MAILSQLLHLGSNARAQLLGVDVGLTDQPGRLLFRHPQRVLQTRAQTGIGRAADLVELGLQDFGDGLEALEFFRLVGLVGIRLDEFATEIVDRLVDLVFPIPAKFGAEAGVVCRHSVAPWLDSRRDSTRKRVRGNPPSVAAGYGATTRECRGRLSPLPAFSQQRTAVAREASGSLVCLCLLPRFPSPRGRHQMRSSIFCDS